MMKIDKYQNKLQKEIADENKSVASSQSSKLEF